MAGATVDAPAKGFRSAAELREVLDRLLGLVDEDERIGPILRAARLRTRFDFTDHELGLNVSSAHERLDRCLEWSFSERPVWEPRLSLEMSSAVANAYLQGRESLPVAIARRLVRCRGETNAALHFLPAARFLVAPYRTLIAANYPHLLVR